MTADATSSRARELLARELEQPSCLHGAKCVSVEEATRAIIAALREPAPVGAGVRDLRCEHCGSAVWTSQETSILPDPARIEAVAERQGWEKGLNQAAGMVIEHAKRCLVSTTREGQTNRAFDLATAIRALAKEGGL